MLSQAVWSTAVQLWLTAASTSRAQTSSQLSLSGSLNYRGVPQDTWLIFVYFVERGFHCVAQAGLKLLGSSSLPASASQSAEIIGVSHGAQPQKHSTYIYSKLVRFSGRKEV